MQEGQKETNLFFDTHVHLDQVAKQLGFDIKDFGTFYKDNLRNEGCTGCINVGFEPGCYEATSYLIQNYTEIYGSYGLHPHNAKEYSPELEDTIVKLIQANEEKVVAWGEIGLDYHYNFASQETQQSVFQQQMQRAVQIKQPLIIHTREAEQDTFKLMKQNIPQDWKIHIHCFTSSQKFAEQLLQEWPNSFIGFTGVITFKSAKSVRKVCEIVPMDRILLETDGPFMAPVPNRGKICHSGMIPHIAKQIAEIKKTSLEKTYQQILLNTERMYKISSPK
eukprot:TRINITY_DN8633_c0_g1_i2.p1 TRINITY_DN8633_c0_g1~~TRINITY_DN8633_c0_g1_i2.p1  ORF type:complete len:278 (+),score=44.26 TRINITY_DN8633_c0_g1_i2:209-1042(+)